MFIYTENDTESDTRIKNNNSKYKHTKSTKTTFQKYNIFEHFENPSFPTSSNLSTFYDDLYDIINNNIILYILNLCW